MPRYDVELSDGRRVTLESESEPTEQEILQALPKPQEKEEAPGAVSTAAREFVQGVGPGAAAAAAFAPGAEVGSVLGPWGALGGGVLSSLAAGGTAAALQNQLLKQYVPDFLRRTVEGEKAHPVAATAGRIASALPSFELAPGQFIKALAPGVSAAARKEAATAVAANLAAQTGITAAQTGVMEHRLPTPGELMESASFAALYGHPRFGIPLPESISKGIADYASRKQKTAALHGDVRPQQEPSSVVPEQKGGAGVQPQAQGVAQETQIPLEAPAHIPRFSGSDETGWTLHFQGKEETGFETKAEAMNAVQQVMAGEREMGGSPSLKTGVAAPIEEPRPTTTAEDDLVGRMEREAIDEGQRLGIKVEPVDSYTGEDPNVPFAGRFLMATGDGAQLKRSEWRNWIVHDLLAHGLSPERVRKAVLSRVGEEFIHGQVMGKLSNTELTDYWNSLTGAEKAIERKIYTGKVEGTGESDANMAHEAIRRRMQQAMGMTPSEFAETVGAENIKLRTLDLLGRMLRATRETITKAGGRVSEIYDKASRNIEYAKQVVGDRGPFASRREGEENLPELIPGDRMVTIQRPDGSTYRAAYGGKEWDMGPLGKFKSIAVPVEGKWSHGMMRPGEQIVEEPGPAARRRDPESQGQLFGKTPLSAPRMIKPTPIEQRGAPELPQRPGEEAAKAVATSILAEDKPNFRDFFDWTKRNIGPGVTSKRALELWADAVSDKITKATGAELAELIKPSKLDLERLVYPFKKVSTTPLTPMPAFEGPLKGGTITTPVTIPDAGALPVHPNDLPSDVRERLPKGYLQELMDRREAAVKSQRVRDKAISAIFKNLVLEPFEREDVINLSRSDIGVDDLGWSNQSTKAGVWRTIRPDERNNMDKVRKIVADEARRFNFDPVSHTKRTLVLLNKNTGEVSWVSAYPHGRSDVNITEPAGGTGVRGKPNVALSRVWHEWQPIISGLLKEPIKDFRKNFKNIEEFNRYIGREAAKTEQNISLGDLGLRDPGEGGRMKRAERPSDWASDVPEWMVMAFEEGPRRLDEAQDLWSEMQQAREGRSLSEMSMETTYRPGTSVLEGEGGGFVGPEAALMRTGGGKLRGRNPMNAREAMSIVDWVLDPGAWQGAKANYAPDFKITNREEMAQAVGELINRARAGTLEAKHWNAISALRKAAMEQFRRDREEFRAELEDMRVALKNSPKEERQKILDDFYQQATPTPEKSAERALDILYDKIQNYTASKSAESIGEILGHFTRPDRPARPPTLAQLLERPVREEKGAQRELSMLPTHGPTSRAFVGPTQPRPLPEGRTELNPPEMLKPEAQRFVEQRAAEASGKPPAAEPEPGPMTEFRLPRGKGQVRTYTTRPSFVIRGKGIIGPEVRQVLPGAIRRAWEDVAEYGAKFTAPLTRNATRQEINATADGVDRMVEGYGVANANTIREASAKIAQTEGGKVKRPGVVQRLLGGATQTKEAKMVRRSAKAVLAAIQVATDEEWSRIAQAWAELRKEMEPIRKEAREKHRKSPEAPPEKVPQFKEPTWVKEHHFDKLMLQVEKGMAKAQDMLNSPVAKTRSVGKRYMKGVLQLRDEVLYAREHFNDPEMLETVKTYQKVMQEHLNMMHANGVTIAGRDYYVPGRYDGELWADHIITWGDMRVLGRNYRMPKSFRNYYEAIAEGPYIPVNGDIADLAQHSLVAGMRVPQRDLWLNSLKGLIDPDTGKPVAIEPAWSPAHVEVPAVDEAGHPTEGTERRKTYTWQVPKGKLDYDLVSFSRNAKPIPVLAGYKGIVESAFAKSQVREIPVLHQSLMLSQMLKHGLILIIDTFHPGRLLQYGAALGGRSWWDPRSGWRGGYSALTYNPQDLARAVANGSIPKSAADWAMQQVKVYDRGQIRRMTRVDLLNAALAKGLNATQTADTLYRNAIQRIPLIGEHYNELLKPINRLIFDKITPGLVAESFVRNFERMNPTNKHLSMDQLMRVVIKDVNTQYGNLGRQGIFKNPTFRDLAQIFLLAPLWQEGLIGKELQAASRLTGVSWLAGRRGLGPDAYFGPTTRAMVRGLAAYFVTTQIANLITRQKFTWQNEEPEHKLDAWIPTGDGKTGIWLSPASVFAEVTHDLIRLLETKPKAWDAITQFGENKLGPLGRISRILREGQTPAGEKITSTAGVLKAAGSELAPTPISVGVMGRQIAHKLAPELVQPPRPGQFAQRLAGMIGVKAQVSTRPEQDIRRLAARFVTKNGLRNDMMAQVPTDEASYSKLRAAIRSKDTATASALLAELRKSKSDEQIVKAMKEGSTRPFSGSAANERMFLYWLDDQGLDTYFKANMDRANEYQDFMNFFVTQPSR